MLPTGLTRRYSLCGDRWDAHSYRVGVLQEPAGRGRLGVHPRRPRRRRPGGCGRSAQQIPLAPAPKYLFIAGGIGITPLIPMIAQAEVMGVDWHLLYGGRTLGSMAFLDDLAAYGDRVEVVPQDERSLLDLPRTKPRCTCADPKLCWLPSKPVVRGGLSENFGRNGSPPRTRAHPARTTAFDVEKRPDGAGHAGGCRDGGDGLGMMGYAPVLALQNLFEQTDHPGRYRRDRAERGVRVAGGSGDNNSAACKPPVVSNTFCAARNRSGSPAMAVVSTCTWSLAGAWCAA